MNISEKTHIPFEILVATTNRTTLDFIDNMFKNNDLEHYHLLIINQTSENKLLVSDVPNIRVINAFERGLSRSRNLAIQHAIGDICLLADDDVVYLEGFENKIMEAFKLYPEAALIHFKAKNFKGDDFRKYPIKDCKHNLKTIRGMSSIEMAINRKLILNKKITFDVRFGLGAPFPTAEESLFCRNILKQNGLIYFNNAFIVAHSEHNSGRKLGDDEIVYARGALNYYKYKKLAYFWIVRYVYFLVKNKYIKFSDVFEKVKLALKGIKDFKKTL